MRTPAQLLYLGSLTTTQTDLDSPVQYYIYNRITYINSQHDLLLSGFHKSVPTRTYMSSFAALWIYGINTITDVLEQNGGIEGAVVPGDMSVLTSMHSLPLNFTDMMLHVQINGLLVSLHVRDRKMLKN